MQREAKDNGEDEGHVHQHVDQVPQVADSATDLVRDEPWVDSLEQLKNTQTQTKDIKTDRHTYLSVWASHSTFHFL